VLVVSWHCQDSMSYIISPSVNISVVWNCLETVNSIVRDVYKNPEQLPDFFVYLDIHFITK
jgi:hypothetical protein